MRIEFTVPGAPQGKERPRFTRDGHTYTPEKTRDYERLVAWAYKSAAHATMFSGSIRAEIVAVYAVPKSWPKRQRERALAGDLVPMVKPDLDNIAKAILDALNGIAYRDDAAVTDLTIGKRYGARPCVAVALEGGNNDTM